jgi:hypothetical protein
MQPAKTRIKKFRLETRYPHLRSEGMTRRRNKGSVLQPDRRKP